MHHCIRRARVALGAAVRRASRSIPALSRGQKSFCRRGVQACSTPALPRWSWSSSPPPRRYRPAMGAGCTLTYPDRPADPCRKKGGAVVHRSAGLRCTLQKRGASERPRLRARHGGCGPRARGLGIIGLSVVQVFRYDGTDARGWQLVRARCRTILRARRRVRRRPLLHLPDERCTAC